MAILCVLLWRFGIDAGAAMTLGLERAAQLFLMQQLVSDVQLVLCNRSLRRESLACELASGL